MSAWLCSGDRLKAPLLLRVALATNWASVEIAQVIGVSRQLVDAILSGARREYLTAEQRAAILAELRLQGSELAELICELELMQ